MLCQGLATSFFNDKNRALAWDLIELLIESKQDTPQWLQALAAEARGAAEARYSAAQRKTPIRRYVQTYTVSSM